jgi:hypothetical protein
MYSSYSFTTSALDRGEWSESRPGRAFTPGERTPGTHCTGGWVGPIEDTEVRGKTLFASAGDWTSITRSSSPLSDTILTELPCRENGIPTLNMSSTLKLNKKLLKELMSTFPSKIQPQASSLWRGWGPRTANGNLVHRSQGVRHRTEGCITQVLTRVSQTIPSGPRAAPHHKHAFHPNGALLVVTV